MWKDSKMCKIPHWSKYSFFPLYIRPNIVFFHYILYLPLYIYTGRILALGICKLQIAYYVPYGISVQYCICATIVLVETVLMACKMNNERKTIRSHCQYSPLLCHDTRVCIVPIWYHTIIEMVISHLLVYAEYRSI